MQNATHLVAIGPWSIKYAPIPRDRYSTSTYRMYSMLSQCTVPYYGTGKYRKCRSKPRERALSTVATVCTVELPYYHSTSSSVKKKRAWPLARGDLSKQLKTANISLYSWYCNSCTFSKHLYASLLVKHIFTIDLIWGAQPPPRDRSIHIPDLIIIFSAPIFRPGHQHISKFSSRLWLLRNFHTLYKIVQTYNRSHTFQRHFKFLFLLLWSIQICSKNDPWFPKYTTHIEVQVLLVLQAISM